MIKNTTKRGTVLAVSHESKLVYLSIAKAASTSLKDYIINNLNGEIRISILKEHLWYEKYEDYFSFSFVRHPIDRLFSCYSNKILRPNIICEEIGVDRIFAKYGSTFHNKMSFKDFLKALTTIDHRTYDPHFRSQHEYVCDKSNNIVVDFIGKVENINADFNFILKQKNLPIFKLQIKNKKSTEDTYDAEAAELAKQVYGVREDMEIFNYK